MMAVRVVGVIVVVVVVVAHNLLGFSVRAVRGEEAIEAWLPKFPLRLHPEQFQCKRHLAISID
jgi:hypothetical protein